MDYVSARRIKFAHLIHAGRSQLDAYTGAGYSANQSEKTRRENACRLMKHKAVQGELARLREESANKAQYDRQELMNALVAEARFDFADVLDDAGHISIEKARATGATRLVRHMRQVEGFASVDAPDRMKAREMICRMQGWYDGAGKDGGDDDADVRGLSDEELAAEMEISAKELRAGSRSNLQNAK